ISSHPLSVRIGGAPLPTFRPSHHGPPRAVSNTPGKDQCSRSPEQAYQTCSPPPVTGRCSISHRSSVFSGKRVASLLLGDITNPSRVTETKSSVLASATPGPNGEYAV